MKLENGRIQVEIEVKGKERTIEVGTVLVAIGRDTDPEAFRASVAGIEVSESGKING